MQIKRSLFSYDEVRELVEQMQKRRMFNACIMEHFRGQGRPEYKLLPYIARDVINSSEIRIKEDNLTKELKSLLKENNIEHILRTDKYFSEYQNNWNLLIQMQHLGLPTRLLDWSLRWDVGLWFAVENPVNDDVDGQFWVFSVPNEIHPTDTRDNFYNKDLNNLDKTYLINAPIYWSDELNNQIGEIKRQRQYGKFSVSSFEKSIIPLENQPDLIGTLLFAVTFRTLTGLSKYCR